MKESSKKINYEMPGLNEIAADLDALIPMYVAEQKEQLKQIRVFATGTKWEDYIQALFEKNIVGMLQKEKIVTALNADNEEYLKRHSSKKEKT